MNVTSASLAMIPLTEQTPLALPIFPELTDGQGNEEKEPDVRYVWKP